MKGHDEPYTFSVDVLSVKHRFNILVMGGFTRLSPEYEDQAARGA